jgi:neutral ceramidase
MKVGISTVDITPAPGVELSGFAVRTQPATGVLDPLYAKALYLEDGDERLLWVHCDLIGFDAGFVASFRQLARQRCGVDENRIMLSATHTHSGPCTLRLRECGEYDSAYESDLRERLARVAMAARARTETCTLAAVEAPLDLAIDRRGKADAHTDPRVGAVGFRREDGTWVAVLVNHAIHPVALGASNRRISADIPGQVAAALSCALAGNPVVLVTNGACANLNPPAVNVPFEQIQGWGREIAAAVAGPLNMAPPDTGQHLRVRTRKVALPLDVLRGDEIDAYAQRSLASAAFHAEWGDRFSRAVEHWRSALRRAETDGAATATREVELMAVALGDVVLLGVNAEIFSRFVAEVRRLAERRVYAVGYANGVHGYLPTRAAFAEGGYETDAAHFFYGGFRYLPGGLELLAQEAVDLVGGMSAVHREKVVA